MRILAIAYACNPSLGSEEAVGWRWTHNAKPEHHVSVICAQFHQPAVECAAHRANTNPPAFHFIQPRPWHYRPAGLWRLIERSTLKPLMNLAYQSWLRDAFKLATRLHRQHRFDLVHLITYVGFRFPGTFYQLDIPFVWGPIGGLENTPWQFLPSMGPAGAAYYAGRNVVNTLQKRLLPGPKKAFAKAAACGGIIAATEGIRREIEKWYGHQSEVIPEVGPPATIADDFQRRSPDEPLRLAWSGRHDAGKALPLLLRALAELPRQTPWNLTILGQGPDTAKWKRLADRLGLADRCTWTGWLPRDVAVSRLHAAHLFVITSLKDLTSTVLLEALSQGLPVLCPDHCGFSNVVTDACGIKLPIHTPKQFSRELAKAIVQLEGNEPLRRQLAAGALLRVHDFAWDKKAEQVEAIYRRAIERYRASKERASMGGDRE